MSGKNFDVFISYRHSDGKDKAISLEANFEKAGCRTFRDDNELRRGAFDKKIEIAVLDAPVFVMVLTSDYFERCNQEGDWVRREIDLAIENGKVIIPINYNGVLKGVPDHLDEEFRKKVGCHTFIALHTDTSFKATLKEIIDNDIKPNVSIVVNNNNRAKLSVKTDANCELIEDDQIIATLQEGTTKQIFVEKGEHEFIARSTEKPDIEQIIEKRIDDTNSKYIIKIKLASKLHKKTKEWWEKNKSKLLITLVVIFGIAILIGVYSSDLGETETPTETATESQTINYTKFTCLQTLKGHSDYVHSVAYSPDGSRIISGSDDNTIKIWDVNIGTCLKTLEGHSNYVGSVSFSPDSIRIISGSYDKTIKIWDANMGVCIKSLYGHSGYVQSVAYSPDGSRIISGSADKTIKMWDSNTGECIKTLKGHSFWVNSVAYSPDGKRIISGSGDETIKIWDANLGICLKTLEEHSGSVWYVAYNPDGSRIISGSDDKTIKIWDSNTGECIKTLKGHSYSVLSVAYSPDGKYIISGSWDNTIKIWDSNTGECIRTLKEHLGRVRSVAYSPDGTRIISGSMDKTIKIWGME
ncbi:MAG: TIR domain-containing protein [Bacteroidales bacterium]|nr:TIR domain-containing protein [Bacteroidales bacterium]